MRLLRFSDYLLDICLLTSGRKGLLLTLFCGKGGSLFCGEALLIALPLIALPDY